MKTIYMITCNQRCDKQVFEVDTPEETEKIKNEMESWGYDCTITKEIT